MLTQTLLQLLVEKLGGCGVECVGLRHQLADLLIERWPRSVEGFGHDHLFFEQLAGLFQRRLTAACQTTQTRLRCGLGGQCILEAEGIVGRQFVQLLQ
ncbi:hypothetical protein D3C77_645490 [compost metagenome]